MCVCVRVCVCIPRGSIKAYTTRRQQKEWNAQKGPRPNPFHLIYKQKWKLSPARPLFLSLFSSLSTPSLSPLAIPISYVKWSSVGPAHQISEASFGDASKLIDEQQGKWTCKAFGSGLSIKPTGNGNNRILGFVYFFISLKKLTRIRRQQKVSMT